MQRTDKQHAKESLSLSSRLFTLVFGLVTLMMLLYIALTTLLTSNNERIRIIQQAEVVAQQIALKAAGVQLDDDEAVALLQGLAAYDAIQHAHLYAYSRNSSVLEVAASYNQPGRAALPSQSAQINDIQPYRFFGEQLEVVHPIQVSRMNNTTATIGYVYLRVSLEGVTATYQRHLVTSFGGFVLLLVTLAVALKLFLSYVQQNTQRFSRLISQAILDDQLDIHKSQPIADEFFELRLQIRRLLEKFRHEKRYAAHSANQARDAYEKLETESQQRTNNLREVNQKLTEALTQLHAYQRRRLEQDKLASLGDLVAGIAHELNTPLGTSLTAITRLQHEQASIMAAHQEKNLTAAQFQEFLDHGEEMLNLCYRNVQRSTELVRHFQQMAMFNRTDAPKKIALPVFLNTLCERLKDELNLPDFVHISCHADDVIVHMRTIIVEHILTELLDNTIAHAPIRHANNHVEPLQIELTATTDEHAIILVFRDNGKGIEPRLKNKVFEPFVTSNRMEGDQGLGLFRVHSWVTNLLLGEISCESDVYIEGDENKAHGTTLTIRMSKDLENDD